MEDSDPIKKLFEQTGWSYQDVLKKLEKYKNLVPANANSLSEDVPPKHSANEIDLLNGNPTDTKIVESKPKDKLNTPNGEQHTKLSKNWNESSTEVYNDGRNSLESNFKNDDHTQFEVRNESIDVNNISVLASSSPEPQLTCDDIYVEDREDLTEQLCTAPSDASKLINHTLNLLEGIAPPANGIKPTKTNDVTKIKGWKNKKFAIAKKKQKKQTKKPLPMVSDDFDDIQIAPPKLDVELPALNLYLTESEMPKLEVEQRTPFSKSKNINKPKTLAKKRKMPIKSQGPQIKDFMVSMTSKKRKGCQESVLNMRKALIEENIPCTRSCFVAATNIINAPSFVVYNGRGYKVPYSKTKQIVAKIKDRREMYKSVSAQPFKKYKEFNIYPNKSLEKPLKAEVEKKEYNPDEWKSVEVKLPKLSLEVIPEVGKCIDPMIEHFITFDHTITQDRIDFALGVLKTKNWISNLRRITFPLAYANNEDKMIMRKPLLAIVPRKTLMPEITKTDSEMAVKQQEEEAPVKKRKRGLPKKLSTTNLEMKRANCKSAFMSLDEERDENKPSQKKFCKLGCISKNIESNNRNILSNHCGLPDIGQNITLSMAPDIFSQGIVSRLQYEAKKDLPKVEEIIKPCVIKLLKHDLSHIIPLCMVHMLYKCHCKNQSVFDSSANEANIVECKVLKAPVPSPLKPHLVKQKTCARNDKTFNKEIGSSRTRDFSTVYYIARNKSLLHKNNLIESSKKLQNYLESYLRANSGTILGKSDEKLPPQIRPVEEVPRDSLRKNIKRKRKQSLVLEGSSANNTLTSTSSIQPKVNEMEEQEFFCSAKKVIPEPPSHDYCSVKDSGDKQPLIDLEVSENNEKRPEPASDDIEMQDKITGWVVPENKEFMYCSRQCFKPKQLISESVDDVLWASIPSITLACKWRVIYMNLEFAYLSLARSSYTIQYGDIMKAVKSAQTEKITIMLKSEGLQKSYPHCNFGIYCVDNYLDKIFVGPYFLHENHDLDTLSFVNGVLVNMNCSNEIEGANIPGSGFWFYQAAKSEKCSEMIDLTCSSDDELPSEVETSSSSKQTTRLEHMLSSKQNDKEEIAKVDKASAALQKTGQLNVSKRIVSNVASTSQSQLVPKVNSAASKLQKSLMLGEVATSSFSKQTTLLSPTQNDKKEIVRVENASDTLQKIRQLDVEKTIVSTSQPQLVPKVNSAASNLRKSLMLGEVASSSSAKQTTLLSLQQNDKEEIAKVEKHSDTLQKTRQLNVNETIVSTSQSQLVPKVNSAASNLRKSLMLGEVANSSSAKQTTLLSPKQNNKEEIAKVEKHSDTLQKTKQLNVNKTIVSTSQSQLVPKVNSAASNLRKSLMLGEVANSSSAKQTTLLSPKQNNKEEIAKVEKHSDTLQKTKQLNVNKTIVSTSQSQLVPKVNSAASNLRKGLMLGEVASSSSAKQTTLLSPKQNNKEEIAKVEKHSDTLQKTKQLNVNKTIVSTSQSQLVPKVNSAASNLRKGLMLGEVASSSSAKQTTLLSPKQNNKEEIAKVEKHSDTLQKTKQLNVNKTIVSTSQSQLVPKVNSAASNLRKGLMLGEVANSSSAKQTTLLSPKQNNKEEIAKVEKHSDTLQKTKQLNVSKTIVSTSQSQLVPKVNSAASNLRKGLMLGEVANSSSAKQTTLLSPKQNNKEEIAKVEKHSDTLQKTKQLNVNKTIVSTSQSQLVPKVNSAASNLRKGLMLGEVASSSSAKQTTLLSPKQNNKEEIAKVEKHSDTLQKTKQLNVSKTIVSTSQSQLVPKVNSAASNLRKGLMLGEVANSSSAKQTTLLSPKQNNKEEIAKVEKHSDTLQKTKQLNVSKTIVSTSQSQLVPKVNSAASNLRKGLMLGEVANSSSAKQTTLLSPKQNNKEEIAKVEKHSDTLQKTKQLNVNKTIVSTSQSQLVPKVNSAASNLRKSLMLGEVANSSSAKQTTLLSPKQNDKEEIARVENVSDTLQKIRQLNMEKTIVSTSQSQLVPKVNSAASNLMPGEVATSSSSKQNNTEEIAKVKKASDTLQKTRQLNVKKMIVSNAVSTSQSQPVPKINSAASTLPKSLIRDRIQCGSGCDNDDKIVVDEASDSDPNCKQISDETGMILHNVEKSKYKYILTNIPTMGYIVAYHCENSINVVSPITEIIRPFRTAKNATAALESALSKRLILIPSTFKLQCRFVERVEDNVRPFDRTILNGFHIVGAFGVKNVSASTVSALKELGIDKNKITQILADGEKKKLLPSIKELARLLKTPLTAGPFLECLSTILDGTLKEIDILQKERICFAREKLSLQTRNNLLAERCSKLMADLPPEQPSKVQEELDQNLRFNPKKMSVSTLLDVPGNDSNSLDLISNEKIKDAQLSIGVPIVVIDDSD